MAQVMTLTSPTEDSVWINNGYPDAVREWCTNGTVVDPATDSVFTVPSETGVLFKGLLAPFVYVKARQPFCSLIRIRDRSKLLGLSERSQSE
jgi:hypothetical protein